MVLEEASHWYICSLRIAYMINLVSGAPEAHFWLCYLLICVDTCWYLFVFHEVCLYLLILVATWQILLIFDGAWGSKVIDLFVVCAYHIWEIWSLEGQRHTSGFAICWYLLICGDIWLDFMIFAYISWYSLLLDRNY